MNISRAAFIKRAVTRLEVGDIITADDFPKFQRVTVHQILHRLSIEGLLVRVKRGVFSRCEETQFGLAKASALMILSKEIEKDDGKCFGGLFLLNQLGLTTQVPAVIEILNNKSRYQIKIDGTRVRYCKVRPLISKRNKAHIMLLEVVKKINKIPDGDIQKTIQWLRKEISRLDKKSQQSLAKTAKDYSPRVRAILGSILQTLNSEISEKLKKTLKQSSYYRVGEVALHLASSDEWNLKE